MCVCVCVCGSLIVLECVCEGGSLYWNVTDPEHHGIKCFYGNRLHYGDTTEIY